MTITIGPNVTGIIPSPLSLSGCVLWFDAADAGSVTLVSSKVSNWKDKSVSHLDVAQATPGSRPTYAGTRNGKSILTFATASTTYLQRSSAALLKNVPGWSIFAAMDTSVTNANAYAINIRDGDDSASRAWLRLTTTNVVGSGGVRLDSDTQVALNGSTPFGTGWGYFGAVCNFATTTLTVYANAVQQAQNTSFMSAGNTSNTNVAEFGIGGTLGAGAALTGDIGEVIVYNTALSASDRAKVEAYLSAKWAI